MAKSGAKSLMEQAAAALLTESLEKTITPPEETPRSETLSGLPSRETEAALAKDEAERPMDPGQFFDFCRESYIKAGRRVQFFIKKDGSYKTTYTPPMANQLTWELLRKKCGPGHFMVICQDATSKKYLKSTTLNVDDEPLEQTDEPGFGLGDISSPAEPASSGADLTTILALMQTQDDRRAQQAREDRLRDEDRRREEKAEQDERRRQDRESRNDLLKLLTPLVPTVLAFILPKKDDTLLMMMKENTDRQEAQNIRMMERLERASQVPPVAAPNPLELIKQLNDARKEGRAEMKELMEMVEEKAVERAEEMGGSGEKDESSLALVLKSLGPVLGAVIAQGKGAPALPQEPQQLPEQDSGEVVSTQGPPAPNPSRQPLAADRGVKTPPSKKEIEQAQILKIILPFLGEQFVRMNNGHTIIPEAAAKESLTLLKAQGFGPDRIASSFSLEAMIGVLRGYKIPKSYDPWFNQYYATLIVAEAPAAPRTRPGTLKAAGRTQSHGHLTGEPGAVAPTPSKSSKVTILPKPTSVAHGDRDGFKQADAGVTTVAPGADAGSATEVPSQLS